jgi:hypothetical protein
LDVYDVELSFKTTLVNQPSRNWTLEVSSVQKDGANLPMDAAH